MKKYNTKPTKGEWIALPEDEEVQIKIRPFSLFSLTKVPSADDVDMSEIWNIFNYCIIDWKGIEGEDGPLECNEDNKRLVYDYDQDLVVFVTNHAGSLREKVVTGKELKN
jgi:hypothetical protein